MLVAVNETRTVVLATRVLRARRTLERLRGLVGRPPLAEGEALLLEPCSSVHTFFMRFPVDVVFLDRAGAEIVAVLERLSPWRASRVYLRAGSALELPAGTVARTGTRVGDRVRIAGQLAAAGELG